MSFLDEARRLSTRITGEAHGNYLDAVDLIGSGEIYVGAPPRRPAPSKKPAPRTQATAARRSGGRGLSRAQHKAAAVKGAKVAANALRTGQAAIAKGKAHAPGKTKVRGLVDESLAPREVIDYVSAMFRRITLAYSELKGPTLAGRARPAASEPFAAAPGPH